MLLSDRFGVRICATAHVVAPFGTLDSRSERSFRACTSLQRRLLARPQPFGFSRGSRSAERWWQGERRRREVVRSRKARPDRVRGQGIRRRTTVRQRTRLGWCAGFGWCAGRVGREAVRNGEAQLTRVLGQVFGRREDEPLRFDSRLVEQQAARTLGKAELGTTE